MRARRDTVVAGQMQNEDHAELLASKKKQVSDYESILQRYGEEKGGGRWYDMGRRRLEELRQELDALEQKFALVSPVASNHLKA